MPCCGRGRLRPRRSCGTPAPQKLLPGSRLEPQPAPTCPRPVDDSSLCVFPSRWCPCDAQRCTGAAAWPRSARAVTMRMLPAQPSSQAAAPHGRCWQQVWAFSRAKLGFLDQVNFTCSFGFASTVAVKNICLLSADYFSISST